MGFQNHYWIDPLLGTSCFHSNRNDSSISLSQGGPTGLSLTITLEFGNSMDHTVASGGGYGGQGWEGHAGWRVTCSTAGSLGNHCKTVCE